MKTTENSETKETMITIGADGELMEVEAIPVCKICRELYDEVPGWDEKTETCQTCREREVF